MSPQDKVERVLKEIHVAFSKSETYNGHPDKVIIDRKQFLNLLDRLNQGIYDMMDQYEQTRQSRSNAERAFRKKGDEIIEAANANAEDVYAASVIYTADMIGAIRELMDHTNDSMICFCSSGKICGNRRTSCRHMKTNCRGSWRI